MFLPHEERLEPCASAVTTSLRCRGPPAGPRRRARDVPERALQTVGNERCRDGQAPSGSRTGTSTCLTILVIPLKWVTAQL